jgi:tetratricopeptide (TPR) repeat protein
VPTLCNLGASHYNRGEYARAIDFYRQALALDPQSQDAHYNLGVAFAEATIYREAILEWRAVMAIDSTTAVAKQAAKNADLLQEVLDETVYKGGKKSRRVNLMGNE